MQLTNDEQLEQLANALGQRLLDHNRSLVTAESCTGGWIAKCCTDIAGSSRWFDRGLVTYSNAAKHELLGVDEAAVQEYGAVSEPVVIQMARGALLVSAADLAVAVTGIAGPGGGTEHKPVGTVWLAVADGQDIDTHKYLFPGDREAVRRQTVACALQVLLDRL